MRIALDAMGGDHAPNPIVAGAIQALEKDPELEVFLVGEENQLRKLVPTDNPVISRIHFHNATQVVGMDESPAIGLRRKPDNTITRSWQLLATGKVQGIVSAGNTGAMVAGGMFTRRFLPHVDRPGIATIMPTMRGPSIMLDVGANVHPKAEHLFQYGVMGEIFARHLLKKEKPTIGLMNVGAEEGKGNELVRLTQQMFATCELQGNFIGNIEGRDIHKGVADVIVTDGFVGNVILKVCEGLFEFIMKMVGKEVIGALDQEKEKGMGALHKLINTYDYSEFGGAPLLGIDGICIICHGSSGERAIKNALGLAAKLARAGINKLIVEELERMPKITAPSTTPSI